MSLTEQFRPSKREDIVGNSKAIDQLELNITSGKVTLVYGPPGVGKTTAVHVIAEGFQWNLREWNASDTRDKASMKSVLRELQNRPFEPTIFLLDEVDGAEDFDSIEACIKNTKNPLVLIANNFYKLPPNIKDFCEQVRFYEPTIQEVNQVIQKIAKATGLKPDFTRINKDFRASINNAFYSGERYSSTTIFEDIESYFKTGSISKLNPDQHLIWLLDNAPEQFKGRKLYTFYQMLEISERLNTFAPMKIFNRGINKVEYPRYFRRIQMFKKKGKKVVEQ